MNTMFMIATIFLAFCGRTPADLVTLDLEWRDDGLSIEVSAEDDVRWRLAVRPHSLRSPGFRVIEATAGGLRDRPAPEMTTYRGEWLDAQGRRLGTIAAGIEGATVRAILLPDAGPDLDAKDLFVIEPNTMGPGHQLKRVEDELALLERWCGTAADPSVLLRQAAIPKGPDASDRVLELGVDTDHEYFQPRRRRGVVRSVEQTFNAVDAIYQRDVDVEIRLSAVVVRPDPDGAYSSTTAGGRLAELQNQWQGPLSAVRRDAAHLLSGIDFDGGVIGVAFVGVICSTGAGYGVTQDAGLSFGSVVGVAAHEIGHNFNAAHCDGDADCWIMCSGIGGCGGDISRFGSRSIASMRTHAASRPCLSDTLEPALLTVPFREDFDATPVLDQAVWPLSIAASPRRDGAAPTTPRALVLGPGGRLESADIDAEPGMPARVGLWLRHRSTASAQAALIEYRSPTDKIWRAIAEVRAADQPADVFVRHEWPVPIAALSEGLRVRVRAVGLDSGESWTVDGISINTQCRADLDGDGMLTIGDFLAFQSLFDAGDLSADFDADGRLTLFDFLAFQAAFDAGCG